MVHIVYKPEFFFSGFLFATAKVASITAMIFFHIIKYTIKYGKLPLITALGLYIFIRGFKRAYKRRGFCPKGFIT